MQSKLLFYLKQRTPLHIAVRQTHVHTVRYLIEKGADINITDKKGVSTYIQLLSVSFCVMKGFLLPTCGKKKYSNYITE